MARRTSTKALQNQPNNMTDADGNPACLRGLEVANLMTHYKPHYATKEEFKRNGGICDKCKAAIKKKHKNKDAVEQPLPMTWREPTVKNLNPDEHAEHALDHGTVQTSDFDFKAVDEALATITDAQPDVHAAAAELVRQIFVFCFTSRLKQPLQAATAKFAIIGAGLRPELLNDMTQTQLANELGITKAMMSYLSIRFQNAFGVKFARSRTAEHRANLAAARLGKRGGRRRTAKPTATPA